jgi:hypothetical protein
MALGREAPSHIDGPGGDPKAKNDEREEEQSVPALMLHTRADL